MCYFVVLALDDDGARRVRATRRLWPMPSVDWVVRRVCGPGVRAYSVTKGCGCGAYSEPRRAPTEEEIRAESDRMQERYLQRGWSWAKAQRAIEASEAKRRRATGEPGGLAREIAELAAMAAEEAGEVGVLAFWCSPGESRPVGAGPVITSGQLRADPAVVRKDEVVRVVAEAPAERRGVPEVSRGPRPRRRA